MVCSFPAARDEAEGGGAPLAFLAHMRVVEARYSVSGARVREISVPALAPWSCAPFRPVLMLLLLVLAIFSEMKRAKSVSQDEAKDVCRKSGKKLRSRLRIQDLSRVIWIEEDVKEPDGREYPTFQD